MDTLNLLAEGDINLPILQHDSMPGFNRDLMWLGLLTITNAMTAAGNGKTNGRPLVMMIVLIAARDT